MFRMAGLLGIATVCFCLFGSVVHAGEAADKELAEKHFKAGLSLLATHNFKVAAEEFESSVKLHPTKSGLFNLAICYFELHQYAEATAGIAKLKSEFKNELDEQWQNEISAFEEKLKKSVVPVEFKTNMDGATIQLDGKPVKNTSKNTPILVDPGEHEITIAAEDYETIKETIEINSGQGKTLYHFYIVNPSDKKQREREEAIVQDTTHPVHFENDGKSGRGGGSKGLRIGATIAFSVGGVSGLTAIATGVVHLVGVSRIYDEADCHNDICTDMSSEAELEKMKHIGVATNVLIAVSAVGLVTGTILAVVNAKKKKKNHSVSLTPSLWKTGGGLGISTTF